MNKPRGTALLIFRVGFPLAIAVSAFAEEKPWYPGCPASIKNSHECAIYQEKQTLKKYPGIVSRETNGLVFRLTDGKTKTLTDVRNKPDDIVIYNVTHVLHEVGYALVHGQYYEGDTYYLVNLVTGQIEHIEGRPLMSPAKTYLLVTFFGGGVSGYTRPAVKIYRLTKPHLTLEESFPTLLPTNPKWITDSRLTLINNKFSEELFRKFRDWEDYYIKEKVTIVLKNGKWEIEKQ